MKSRYDFGDVWRAQAKEALIAEASSNLTNAYYKTLNQKKDFPTAVRVVPKAVIPVSSVPGAASDLPATGVVSNEGGFDDDPSNLALIPYDPGAADMEDVDFDPGAADSVDFGAMDENQMQLWNAAQRKPWYSSTTTSGTPKDMETDHWTEIEREGKYQNAATTPQEQHMASARLYRTLDGQVASALETFLTLDGFSKQWLLAHEAFM